MHEKQDFPEIETGLLPSQGMIRTPHGRTPHRILAFLLSLGLGFLFFVQIGLVSSPMSMIWSPTSRPFSSTDAEIIFKHNVTKVPLEAHIMSKCPDARDCLRDFVVPAMEKVVDKVDFRLSFIGDLDDDDSVHCKHGQTECLGNILSLCANELYRNDTKIWLGFTTCMVLDYKNIPGRSLVQNCALEHGVDFDRLNDCVSEEGIGLDLLEASVKRSKDAKVKKSCTIRLDGEVRCIRDEGKWKDCKGGSEAGDLVSDVEKLYKAKNEDG